MGFLQTPVQPCPVVAAESQPGEIQGDVLLVQEPQHQTFPMEGGQGGNPHVHLPVLPGFLEPSVLGQPFFSDVHAGKDLKPGNQRVLEIFGTVRSFWSTPSSRQRITIPSVSGSRWMSLAPCSKACSTTSRARSTAGDTGPLPTLLSRGSFHRNGPTSLSVPQECPNIASTPF